MPGQVTNKRELFVQRVSRGLILIRGPWPIHPFVFAVLAFFLSQFARSRVAALEGVDSVGLWIEGIPQGLIAGMLVVIPLWITQRVMKATGNRRTQEFIFHVGALATSVTVAAGFGLFHHRAFAQISLDTVKIYIALCAASILAEITESRLRVQAEKAQAALVETERHRLLLLDSEEHTRREVASFLHNQVQAGLVVAAMQLKQTSLQTQGQLKAQLNSVVAALEEIRAFDVRDAGRQLSPDFEILTLDSALEQLMQSYQKSMASDVVVEPESNNFPADMSLGIYRICEQAVLNAAIHGNSTGCFIRVDRTSDESLLVTVENNGSPVSTSGKNWGTGLAVVDAWVHKYNGTWSIKNTREGTVLLKAVLHPL